MYNKMFGMWLAALAMCSPLTRLVMWLAALAMWGADAPVSLPDADAFFGRRSHITSRFGGEHIASDSEPH